MPHMYFQVFNVTAEWKDANIKAAAEVSKSLNEKKRKLQESIDEEKERIEAKKGKWADSVINDMEEDLKDKIERLHNVKVLLSTDQLIRNRKLSKCEREKLFNYLQRKGLRDEG